MGLTCCDTSFLFSFYGNDAGTARAKTELARLTRVLSVSVLNEFELENSVRLSVFRNTMDPTRGGTLLTHFASDVEAGRLVFEVCNLGMVFAEAKRLSVQHTIISGYRSFDILHVAASLHLGATDFLSFDLNQRKLAKTVGLKVRPA